MTTAKVLNLAIPTSPKDERHDSGWLWLYLEDFQDGRPDSKHFFARNATPETRFYCWQSGGGLAKMATKEEAMKYLHDYAAKELEARVARLEAELELTKRSLKILGKSPRRLDYFAVTEDWTPAMANGKQSY